MINLEMLRTIWENKHGLIKFPDMNIKISNSWKEDENL